MDYKEAKKKAILLVLGGSHAYGMATKDSDEDERGIVIGPIESYLGFSNFEQAEDKVNDGVIYELKKFCRLALNANPNIWDILFSEEVRRITSAGKILRDNRELFLSKKARFTFAGYAATNLKKLKAHRGNFTNKDTKHAMHLVRLLRMGREILEDGVVNVKRPDAEELLAIRNGAWTYEQLEEFANKKDLSFQTLYDKSPLPKTPDYKKVEDLTINLILDNFEKEKEI